MTSMAAARAPYKNPFDWFMTQETQANSTPTTSTYSLRSELWAINRLPAMRTGFADCCGLLVESSNDRIAAVFDEACSVSEKAHLLEDVYVRKVPFTDERNIDLWYPRFC